MILIFYIKFLSISVWKSHGRCKYLYVYYSWKNLKIVYRQQIDALVYTNNVHYNSTTYFWDNSLPGGDQMHNPLGIVEFEREKYLN